MWTTLGALVIISGLFLLVLRYAKAAVRQDIAKASADAAAQEEKERREQAEAQALAESKKRVKEFDEKAAAATDADAAAKLLKDAAGRTSRGTLPR